MARLSLVVAVIALMAVVAVSAQKRCCAPEQFLAGTGATVGESSPGPTAFYSNSYGAYDFKNKRYGLNVTIAFLNNTDISYRLIQKYSKAGDFQWIIYDQYKLCIKQPITTASFQNCIPENATFLANMTIGGPSGVFSDVWSYEMSTPKDPIDGRMSATVTHKGCYPVGNSFVGNRYDGSEAVPMVATSGVYNMTVGLGPDPDSWFILPSYCEQKVNEVLHRRVRSLGPVHDYYFPVAGFRTV